MKTAMKLAVTAAFLLMPSFSFAATATATVTPSPVIGLEKSVVGGIFTDGDTVTFSINYQNASGASYLNYEILDTLPQLSDFIGALPAPASVVPGTGSYSNVTFVTWNLGTLAPGASGTILCWITKPLTSWMTANNCVADSEGRADCVNFWVNTATGTCTKTATPAPTFTRTPTQDMTTSSATATRTFTETWTWTVDAGTPELTVTPTITETITWTPNTGTATRTFTVTRTWTADAGTATPTATETCTWTQDAGTPVNTMTATRTFTETWTWTVDAGTATPTFTGTCTWTQDSGTPVNTMTATRTLTETWTWTLDAGTPAFTATPTSTLTPICNPQISVNLVYNPSAADYVLVEITSDQLLSPAPSVRIVPHGNTDNKPEFIYTATLVSAAGPAVYNVIYPKQNAWGDIDNVYVSGVDTCGNSFTSSGSYTKETVAKADVVLFKNIINPEKDERCRIVFNVYAGQAVKVKVHNKTGMAVRVLYDGVAAITGRQEVIWDGRNEKDESVVSGMYLISVDAGRYKAVEKMAVVH